ncbi:MAG TPA: hypothetical protein PKV94_04950 [Syntrophales bacterium]|jgi:uncharacterized FlaG/YvyC family protein|nr:hypothetical protein [Syntrophales bacterium]HPI56146.1 hypothetical protein [Syntrophales bacterium]HPN24333.1 hypothetical protein [Syntrophales bacterium]
MSTIDTRIKIYNAVVEKNVDLAPQKKKSSDHEKSSLAALNHLKPTASYSLYGSHNERIAIVFKNDKTGRIICEIPSRYLQELHAWLEEMEYRLIDKRI